MTKDTKPMWISPILAFDDYEEAKKYYEGIIEKTFKDGPFDCSEDYSDECQKEVLAAYLMILACPKDSRNLRHIGLMKFASSGMCHFITISCKQIFADDYNSKLLEEIMGDHHFPFGADEFNEISPKKPMWSFQNRRDYLVDVLAKHTTIPLETLKGLEGVKLPRNPKGLVEWCKSALAGDFDSIVGNDLEEGTPGLCYYSKWSLVGNYETVGIPMKTALKVFLNPYIGSDTNKRSYLYPFGGIREYFVLDAFEYPWIEPKRRAFLQRIVLYYEGQADWVHSDDIEWVAEEPQWQGDECLASIDFTELEARTMAVNADLEAERKKGIGDQPDYQTYLNERMKWCKGPKGYVTTWIRNCLNGSNVPQTVFANREKVGLPA